MSAWDRVVGHTTSHLCTFARSSGRLVPPIGRTVCQATVVVETLALTLILRRMVPICSISVEGRW